jgi:uroporphyrinogen-III synthase
MPGLVVLTRPREQSEPLAATLKARGYAVLIEPMLEIVPLDVKIPASGGYGALAFSSANAVSIFAERCSERDLAAYAVGRRTAAVLRDAGFRDVREAAGDADELAQLIEATYRDTIPVLHLSGRAIARDLAVLLRPAGIAVERVPIYDAVATGSPSKELVEALYACTVDSVLFFSARTAEIFGTLVLKFCLNGLTEAVSAICLSRAVAESAQALTWRSLVIASRPTVDAMLAVLPPCGQDTING